MKIAPVGVAIIAAAMIFMAACDPGTDPKNAPENVGASDLPVPLSQCGHPDNDDTTLFDQPRPLIPTRIIDYRHKHVRILYVLKNNDGPVVWQLVGATDTRTKKALSVTEFERRLPCVLPFVKHAR